jgi:hypothetical protein
MNSIWEILTLAAFGAIMMAIYGTLSDILQELRNVRR